ncbi:hypothetical protein BpHYR1_021875 [Brachionus plicatilis]|uniref:Uncharacterized protein n=1 Tax=Brachionus plicatilis TaxID=10195 RepID=A0A3M7T426_BRAPC|nr:hypothetical protein BpHYR1_021875 [Brachionus plicatilis]
MGNKNVCSLLKWEIVLKSGDKKQNEMKLLGVSPKFVFPTKKRYEETGTVSDRSWCDSTSSYQKPTTDFNSKSQGIRISNLIGKIKN